MIIKNILVINSGSSTIKFQLIDICKKKRKIRGMVERIGNNPVIEYDFDGRKVKRKVKAKNHEEALKIIINCLLKSKVIKDFSEIDAVGHRVVHGGEKHIKPTIITNRIIKDIEKFSDLAPLHNPSNLKGIIILRKILNVPQVAIFDTAFHGNMPKESYLYGLPLEFYKKFKIRRYGFHGTSHKYVSREAIKILKKMKKSYKKIVTCHIGNGISLTAVLNGKSVDTSMGFTPLEGVLMGTRSGSFDPAIIEFLNKKGYTTKEIIDIANKKSGLLGISGINNDMRVLLKSKNERAKLAINMFVYSIVKYIGAYAAAMNGLDAIVFTAGIGEHSSKIRRMICDHFKFLGLNIDDKKNNKNNIIISTKDSKITALVIPTNEELQIALETKEVLKKTKR